MRILVLPIAAVGVIFFLHTDEPTEKQMRGAFERSLAAEVADTMAFISESGDREAVERVRMARNDRFEIRNFRKVDCQSAATKSGFDCAFTVNIALANGPMRRMLKGRFYTSSGEIKFAFESEFQVDPVPTLVASTQAGYAETKADSIGAIARDAAQAETVGADVAEGHGGWERLPLIVSRSAPAAPPVHAPSYWKTTQIRFCLLHATRHEC